MKPEYKLIKKISAEEMQAAVNEAIEIGFEPYMGLVVGGGIYTSTLLYQWMVRYVVEDYEVVANGAAVNRRQQVVTPMPEGLVTP
jgi:hypothetical protein